MPDVFETVEFVNADEIARGLSPFNPEGVAFQAARIFLERLNYLVSRKESFAFETTLSGLTYLKFIESAKRQGYDVTVFFIWLNNFLRALFFCQIRVKIISAQISSGKMSFT